MPRRPESTPRDTAQFAELETFLARREDAQRSLPRFVEQVGAGLCC